MSLTCENWNPSHLILTYFQCCDFMLHISFKAWEMSSQLRTYKLENASHWVTCWTPDETHLVSLLYLWVLNQEPVVVLSQGGHCTVFFFFNHRNKFHTILGPVTMVLYFWHKNFKTILYPDSLFAFLFHF